ncbi:hypothetical protein LTR62_000409 [Meristemomyces frigidus]|uniref:Mediator of RNA polymerase II transcription subunit 16 n=1 Tax=Meristemomyces frigidus TaxID=1508187 RepID=A0AAN7YM35_9PEZI|nr:hypothetical protein LTR62_000409 [Meristemomyces frigidus]
MDSPSIMHDSTMDDTSLMTENDITGQSMMDQMGDLVGDDLFGDGTDGLGVTGPMPLSPLPASVSSRIHEMQRVGCQSRLAWSRNGSIAQIAKDGGTITFHCTIRDPRNGMWKLSTASESIIKAPDSVQYVHLAFNRTGSELVVVDHAGGVYLYTSGNMLGRMHTSPTDPVINETNRTSLDQVVGLHWLATSPRDFQALYIAPASKVGYNWVASMRQPDQNMPRVHNALEGRHTLFYVSATSKLTMLYQDEQAIWHAVSLQLEEWHMTHDLLTHAAMGEDGDRLLLVTHDHARRMRVYRIVINWNTQQQRRNGVNVLTVSPSLDVSNLCMLGPQHAGAAQLASLHILPAAPPHADQLLSATTIVVAVFVHASQQFGGMQQNDYSSLLARWSIETNTPTLHESFTKLKSTGAVPVASPVTVLRRQPDILISKVILDMQPFHRNTTIALINSLGTIDLYDCVTWTPIVNFGDTTTASSLPQSGLDFTAGEHVAIVASNVDGGMLAYTTADDKIDTKHVSLRYGWQPMEDGITDTKAVVETAVVCLARQYAQLAAMSASTDETLATLPTGLSTESKVLFVRQLLKTLVRTIDVSMMDQQRQQQMVLRESLHLRAISAQLILNDGAHAAESDTQDLSAIGSGTKPGRLRRPFASQFAYVYLNMRQNAVTLMTTFAPREKDLITKRPEVIPSLTGVMKWFTNLIIYMMETLRRVQQDLRETKDTATATTIFENLMNEQGNPTLILLLSSFSRILLGMQTRVLPTYVEGVKRAANHGRTLQQRLNMESFLHMIKTLPFEYRHFIELIQQTEAAVRKIYTDSGTSAERRVENELDMITSGRIPTDLQPVAEQLISTIFPRFCSHETTDIAALYFWDTEWLGIAYAVPAKGEMRHDALRKIPLVRSGVPRRQCKRCGSQMEDILPEERGRLPDWLRNAQRQCFCQGLWCGVEA